MRCLNATKHAKGVHFIKRVVLTSPIGPIGWCRGVCFAQFIFVYSNTPLVPDIIGSRCLIMVNLSSLFHTTTTTTARSMYVKSEYNFKSVLLHGINVQAWAQKTLHCTIFSLVEKGVLLLAFHKSLENRVATM